MIEAKLILKFLTRQYKDEDLIIYLYVCGNVRSANTAIKTTMNDLKKIFSPPLDEEYVKRILIEFLEHKKSLYKKGLIKVKPIYHSTS